MEIISAASYSPGFPKPAQHEVLREHLVTTIEKIILSGAQVVLLEGEEGLGATTLLSQFARLRSDKTVSCFISPTSRFAYDPAFLRTSLANQIIWLLDKKELGERLVSEGEYRETIFRLQRRAQRTSPYFFVVDGLPEIPAEDESIRELIIRELLPIGVPELRFIISAQQASFSRYFHGGLRTKAFPLSPFSPPDTSLYLGGLHLSEEELRKVQTLCSGVPANLSSVRRLLESGRTLEQILEAEPEDLPDFLEIEWERFCAGNDDQHTCEALAILAFGRRTFSVHEIASILQSSEEFVGEQVSHCGFIEVDLTTAGISFITDAHRRFVERKLIPQKQLTINRLIDNLLRQGTSEDRTALLPGYFEQAGRYTELLDMVSEEHLSTLVRQTSSITALQRDVALALETASKLSSMTRLFKFAVLRSTLTQLVATEPWLPEIEAHIALGDLGQALAIANAASTKESRLRLLAAYGRLLTASGREIDNGLCDQIVSLAEDVDMSSLGMSAIEIARDLVVIAPNTAIKIIEAFGSQGQQSEELDDAFVRLAVTVAGAESAMKEATSTSNQFQERIKDESLRKLVGAVSALLGKGTGQDVIAKIASLESNHRSYILRQWIMANREHIDALDVVEYALDHMISDTAASTTLRDLRQIAVALPYAKDHERLRRLVKRIDSQRVTLRGLGSAEENIRLEMLIARAEARCDAENSVRRVESAMEAAIGSADMEVKCDCISWILGAITEMDLDSAEQRLKILSNNGKEELSRTLSALLKDTAHQELVVGPSIRALSTSAYEVADAIACRLNTEERRNKAHVMIVRAIVETRRLKGRLSQIGDALRKISDPEIAGDIYAEAIEAILDLPAKTIPENELVPFIQGAASIEDVYCRAAALVSAIKIATRWWPQNKSFVSSLAEGVSNCVERIDAPWLRAELYFECAAAVAESTRDLALHFMARAAECKNQQTILGSDLNELFDYTLRLATRALAGATTRNVFSKDHIDRLEFLIEQCPSLADQGRIWGDFAMRCRAYGAIEFANEITSKHVWPAVSGISPEDRHSQYVALTTLAPCLYLNSPGATDALLGRLFESDRDIAYLNICDYIVNRLSPEDPRQGELVDRKRLEYTQVLEFCAVLGKIHYDDAFHDATKMLVDALSNKQARDWINRQQRAELAERLEDLANSKLPDKRNITHEGFLIACLAHIWKLKQVSSHDWDVLIARALKVPNVADRAVVLGIVAMAMPSKLQAKRVEALTQAEALVKTIPSEADRVQRFEWLASMAEVEEPVFSRKFVRYAFESTLVIRDEGRAVELRREAIELANRIDPDYANQLARMLDDDPAKIRARNETRAQLELLKTKKMLSEAGKFDARNKRQKQQIPQAAWMSLGALNARRVEPQKLDGMSEYLLYASANSLKISYPVFAWIIENANRRYSATDQARDVCIALSEAALMAGSLLQRIMAAIRGEEYRTSRSSSGSNESIVIEEGQRERGRQVIADWVRFKAGDLIRICDPYFLKDSLWILKVIKGEKPGCRVSILTGRAHFSKGTAIEEEFKVAWRAIADFEPPETDIIIAGIGNDGKAPIHERWLLSEMTGLRLGTSLADLGGERVSEISSLSDEDVIAREEQIESYLSFQKRLQSGERIRYNSFSLP